MKYFAYGSNMSLLRLKKRVASAKRVGVFKLFGHSLRFHKISKDGSGKCDALLTRKREDYVLGVLFEIDDHERPALDKVESLGHGYKDKTVIVADEKGNEVEALTYIAIKTDASLRPYSWYMNHVLKGAEESCFPASYVEYINAVRSIEDPDRARDAKERAIYN